MSSESEVGAAVAEWAGAPPVVHPDKIKLLRATKARGASDEQITMLVELAARYGLDPMGNEIGLVGDRGRDGEEGERAVMIRRDGLRKIVMREGLRLDGDVVRQRDTFRIARKPDRTREVEHFYEQGASDAEDAEQARGPIIAAWAECWDEDTGKQRGYFYAPLSEYKPTEDRTLKETAWGAQESAMLLAAAERQSARQATALSGMVVEGEMDRGREMRAGLPADDPQARDVIERAVREVVSEEWAGKLIPLVLRVNELSPNTWLPATIQMQFGGQDDATLENWLADLTGSIGRLEAQQQPRAGEPGDGATEAE